MDSTLHAPIRSTWAHRCHKTETMRKMNGKKCCSLPFVRVFNNYRWMHNMHRNLHAFLSVDNDYSVMMIMMMMSRVEQGRGLTECYTYYLMILFNSPPLLHFCPVCSCYFLHMNEWIDSRWMDAYSLQRVEDEVLHALRLSSSSSSRRFIDSWVGFAKS